MAIYRFVSDNVNTYWRISPAPFIGGQIAQLITTKFPFWPEIVVENPIPQQPAWVWSTNPVSPEGALNGEIRNFGRAATLSGMKLAIPVNVEFNIAIAADNAFRGKLRITSFVGAIPCVVAEFDIPDGDLNPDVGFVEVSPPYRWQQITTFSGEVPITAPTTSIRFDLEILGVNYVQLHGTPATNPAGIQFLLELANLSAGLTVNNEVPAVLFS